MTVTVDSKSFRGKPLTWVNYIQPDKKLTHELAVDEVSSGTGPAPRPLRGVPLAPAAATAVTGADSGRAPRLALSPSPHRCRFRPRRRPAR
jgi:hypothetical protein